MDRLLFIQAIKEVALFAKKINIYKFSFSQIILILFFTIVFFKMNRCQNDTIRYVYIEKKDSLNAYKNKMKQYEVRNKILEVNFKELKKTSDKRIKELLEKAERKTNTVAAFNTNTKFDTIVTVVKSNTNKSTNTNSNSNNYTNSNSNNYTNSNISIIDTQKVSVINKWISLNASIYGDSAKISLEVRNEYDIQMTSDEIIISNLNPYTNSERLTVLRKERKKRHNTAKVAAISITIGAILGLIIR